MFPNHSGGLRRVKQPLFAPASLQLSEKVHWLARRGLIDPLSYVQRHVRGDWGEIDEATRQANDVALDQDNLMIVPVPDHAGTGVDREDQRRPPDHGGPASRRARPDLRHRPSSHPPDGPLHSARGVVAQ